MVDYTRLVVVPRGEGVTEWRVEVPLISPADVAFLLALGGLVSWVTRLGLGLPWEHALPMGAAFVVLVTAAQLLVEIHAESLTYERGAGLRLEARRRCGFGQGSCFVPLRRLDGLVVHKDESGKRDRHFLALTLKPADGSAPAAEGEMVEAELAFANLAPRGALVRQIYEQLSPLLAADLKQAAQRGARAVAAAGSEAAGASGPTEAKKEK